MRRLVIVCVASLVLTGSTLSQEWHNSTALSPGFLLQWTHDSSTIEIEMTVRTKGWVGIGFGIGETMAGADLIIGGIRDGEPYVWDCYARRNGAPTVDQEQNVEILGGSENATHTTINVKRSLAVNNVWDNTITNGEMIILWAFGGSDKDREWRTVDYHRRNRGAVNMALLGIQKDEMSGLSEMAEIQTSTTTQTTTSKIMRRESTATDKPSTMHVNTVFSPKLIGSGEHELGLPYISVLDEDTRVTLFWDFDEATITMQILAPSTGWIGLGFGRTASMNGADILMMGMKGGQPYAFDCHSDRNGVPTVDEEQNVEIVGGWENGTHTAVTIRRKRLTCNADDMDLQKPTTYIILWAYGKEDLEDDNIGFQDYHRRNRGGRSLKLIYPVEFRTAGQIRQESYTDVGPVEFLVPATETYYLCKFIKVAEANETIYITEIRPLLQKGNEKNVHHATIYLCDVDVTEEQLEIDYKCYEQVHPFSVGCNKVLGGWAVGSSGIRFPENSGFPLGGAASHPQYVMIEMHYDNPDRREFRDSSGLRLSFVREPPQFLSSLFDISQTISTIWIPPGASRYRVGGYCRDECLSKGMEKSGLDEVKVFGVFFHSHSAGRAMRLRHYRNGTEMQAMARDEYYDFNYQEALYFEEPKILKAGDSLTLECDYATEDRDKITPGGLPTTSEMCLAFVMHYPPLDMSICASRAKIDDPKTVFELATGLGITVNATELTNVYSEMRVNYWNEMEIFARKILSGVVWTDEKRKFAQDFTDNMTLYTSCIDKRDYMENFFTEFVVPRGDDYVEKQPVCLATEEGSDQHSDSTGDIMSSVAGVTAMLILILGVLKVVSRKS